MDQLLSPEQIAQSVTEYLKQAFHDPDWHQIEQYLAELFMAQSRNAYEQAILIAKSHRSPLSGALFALAQHERDDTIEDIVQSIRAMKKAC